MCASPIDRPASRRFRDLFRTPPSCPSSRRSRAARQLRPGPEGLECRSLLSAFTVTSAADDGSAGTLRSEIGQANASTTTATITFDSSVFASPKTIALDPTLGPLELSNTHAPVEIRGPAARVTIDGGGKVEVMKVDLEVDTLLFGLTIAHGFSVAGGGGISNYGLLTVTDSTLSDNSAAGSFGGGISNVGTLDVSGSTLSGNSAALGGGAISNALDGILTVTGSILSDNSAQGGVGGAIANSGTLTVSVSALSGNSATFGGGGISNTADGTAEVLDSTLTGNSDFTGGGIKNSGTLTVSDSTLSGNSATEGGGIKNAGALVVTGSTLAANSATNGGGIDNRKTLLILGSTLSGNSATQGGGISNDGSATVSVSTLSGNSATFVAGGISNSGTLTVTSSTLAANSASDSGGIDNRGTLSLYDSIVAKNTAGDVIGKPFSGSANFIGDTDGDPLLAPLGDYGGRNQTMALLPGSPALGAGDSNASVVDERSIVRPRGTADDIGAFESRGFTIAAISGSDQATPVNTDFSRSLKVQVTANAPGEPVAGGLVAFAPPSSGASATTPAAAVIAADGTAAVKATANATVGSYTVAASAAGTTSASFRLTNQFQPTFVGLAPQVITYGTSTATLSGTLSMGSTSAAGSVVVIVPGGRISVNVLIIGNGSFTATIDTSGLPANPASPYLVTYIYISADVFQAGAQASTSLTVNKAAQTVNWANPSAITYGTPLTATQLNATVSGVPGGTSPGALTFTPAAGTVLNAGLGQTLSVTAAETANYLPATKTVTINVNKATQTVTWASPAAITYGTPLTATQLDATVSGSGPDPATGAVTYAPPSGTVLNAGLHQLLSVTAAETANYLPATKTVSIDVKQAPTAVALASSTNPSVPGQYVTLTATVTTPIPGAGTPAGSVIFVDASTVPPTALGTSALAAGVTTISVPFTTLGAHRITATYSPTSNYAAGAPAAVTEAVQPVALEPGPVAGQWILAVGGTNSDDNIDIHVRGTSNGPDQSMVHIHTRGVSGDFNTGWVSAPSGSIVRVVAYGLDGNDSISVDDQKPGVAAWLFGGAGDDELDAGNGPSVLVGGDGNDTLKGGNGPSLLIGGRGADKLQAGQGSTALVGGSTDLDTPTPASLAALDAVLSEVDAGGRNLSSLLNGSNVHDDGAADSLTGGGGTDWFFANVAQDTVMKKKAGDVVIDTSGW